MLTSALPEKLAAMGIKAFADVKELMQELDLENKSVYVIPNGSTVIPTLKKY